MFCLFLVCGILAANSRIKMLFVKCPCAFRRRRLAQSVGCGLRARHFSYELSRNMALVTCLCAFRLRRLAQNVGCGLGIHLGRGNLVEIRAKPLQEALHQDFEDALHDLAQVLDRKFCGHPGAILLEVLVRKLLWEALGVFLYQDLVRRVRFSSGRFFCMQGSWHEDLAERDFFHFLE